MTNPKDKVGATKVDLSLLSPVALIHMAGAMMEGEGKYGRYNWRDQPVQAHIYQAAAFRHMLQWYGGERTDSKSRMHHLGHAMACFAILLDAEHNGTLIDDRPSAKGASITELLEAMSWLIQREEQRIGFCGRDCNTCREERECNFAEKDPPSQDQEAGVSSCSCGVERQLCPGECRYCEHAGCEFGAGD